jgi:low affinity Fe/Cu permease
MNEWFRCFASRCAQAVGSKYAFILAVGSIVVWAILGPHFHYSDTWQLVINTGTTIVTFLMVFLIQNTQNRDAKAIHLKLDELLRAVKGARTGLVNLEDLSDEDLAELQRSFQRLRERHSHVIEKVREKAEQIEQKSGDPDAVRDHAREIRDVAERTGIDEADGQGA